MKKHASLPRRIRVANVLPDGRLAGPTARVLQVARGLKGTEAETIIVFPQGDGEFARILDSEGIEGLPVSFARPHHPRDISGNLEWLFRIPRDAILLSRALTRSRIDLIHCNGLLQIIGPVAGSLSGVPVLWHMNDLMVPRIVRMLLKPLVIRLSNGLVFSSKAVMRQFGRLPEALPKTIIYPPVDTKFFDSDCAGDGRTAVRRALGVGSDTPLVGMVANVNGAKGVPDFVEAAGIIARRHPDVMFIHVGARLETRAELYASIENRIRELDLSPRFVMAGRRTNVRDYLAAMDVFVMPSISEAVGMTLLEAMAMAKPIVATNVGGIPELVQERRDALLVPCRSPIAIAEKVAMLLDGPDLGREMGRAAREQVLRNFDLTQCVEMHQKCYRDLIAIG